MKKLLSVISIVFILISCDETKKEVTSTSKERILPELKTDRYNVAFLLMDGTFNTEFTAPFDIFQHTQYRKNIKAMNTFTIANTLEPITTFEGVRILPDFDYTRDSLPIIDILVVPSAEHHLDTDLNDSIMINFVKKVDKNAMYMTSHCDGAFVLAKAGILNDVTSTTFPSDIKTYRKMFPHLKVKDSVLFVHDGKYITSAGGAKSFEAALYLCEVLYGKEITESLAGGLVIDWDLESFPKLIVKK
ncbi:glutamine amidotransferase [Maribacter algarum]|uniref:Glutamine amidotransferase n=1 Tax=Maribacter algarum (ex Zhang et al. 2020) TaxID=2578118 RepID=A0A5S3PIC9_9FLAO|nr:DJ-1/PfpI family protein [Maribacter algarum]TMM53159.1 glutamine amidotransferase [Maribacter algarum]